MRKTIWVLGIAILLVGLGLGLAHFDHRLWTTCSGEAYDLYLQGNDQLTAFQADAAVASLKEALELDPEFAMAAAALAQGFGRQGKQGAQDSMMVYADCLAANLTDPTERMLVQLRLADLGFKPQLAVRDSLHAALLVAAPENVILLTSLAGRANRAGDTDEAERFFRKILELNPNYASAYNELGYIEFHRGNYDKALEMLQRYAFLAPEVANPHDSLGEILIEIGRYEDAELELVRALSLEPDYLPSLLNLARVYLAQGQEEKGIGLVGSITRQMEGTPFERQVRDFAIWAYFSNRRWEDLARSTAEFVALYPESPRSLIFRGMKLAGEGRIELATAPVDSYFAHVRSQPGFGEKPETQRRFDILDHESHAMILQSGGRFAEAAALWAKGIELGFQPRRAHDQVFEREQYCACLLAMGDFAEALRQADEVLNLNPRNGLALLTAARASLALDRPDEARQLSERLLASLAKADPDFFLLREAQTLQLRLDSLTAGS